MTALLARALLSAALAPLAHDVWAQVPGEKTVAGIVIRIGLASADQLSSHPPGHSEAKMHPSQPRTGREHLVISLAQEHGGRRIDDATVTASVSRIGMDHVSRGLERMPAPQATTYGGYFDFRQPGPYRIRIEVSRPAMAAPVVAEFDYRNR